MKCDKCGYNGLFESCPHCKKDETNDKKSLNRCYSCYSILANEDHGVSKRGINWNNFQEEVLKHIEFYTVLHYGDAPNDNVEKWTAEECFKQVDRYMKRRNSNQRDGQKKLDILKAAHYLSLGYEKLEKEDL